MGLALLIRISWMLGVSLVCRTHNFNALACAVVSDQWPVTSGQQVAISRNASSEIWPLITDHR
jgi:hypothetical protein